MTGPGNARSALVTAVLGALLATTSCSLLGGRSAQDEADELAVALTAGKPGAVSYVGGTPAQAQQLWDRTVAGLGEGAKATVSVDGVTEGDPSSARLRYSWSLPGAKQPWTYGTTVELDESDDDSVGDEGWRVRLAPSLVHPDLGTGDRLAARRTFADRAAILGAGGTELVAERPVQRFGIDKLRVPRARELSSARSLAVALGIDVKGYVARVRAAGDRAFVEAIVLRVPEARAALRNGAGDVPGVAMVRDTLPLAPTRDFARPVLGTFGAVTAEMVKESDGAYVAGDESGLSGLQARYDAQLRGTPGLTVEGGGKDLFTDAPVPGTPLSTTLDIRLQRLAEETLAGVRPASALVALRPSTGNLLAVASGPGSEGYSTATVGQYAPGSTFKVVSSLALLRSGVRPASQVSCPATTVVDGKRFKNYDDYPADGLGEISFATAVANSCNTAFIGQRDAVNQAEVADAAAALGLGVDHDLGFPAYFGSVPATAAEAGSETGRAASLIGQGTVLASPMAMAAVAASVARGATVVPRLLPAQPADDDKRPGTPLTGPEAAQLRSLMRGVVTRGSGSFLASVPGPPVLAKTGTAEFGTRAPLQTHAWMIAARGDLAVAVFVDVGDSGSGTAGPLLERFLRAAR